MTTASPVGVIAIATATDAWFRGLQTFSDALTTLGIPKTADTGQINWATVTVPANSNFSNYEIRRLDDAEQATDPLFMKIAYGRITVGAAQHPAIQITVGTGSNGSGTLTGAVGTAQTVMLQQAATSFTSTEWLMSGDGHGFALLGGPTTLSRVFLCFERLRGADGDALTGQFLLLKNSGAAAHAASQYQAIHYDFVRAYMETLGIPITYVVPMEDEYTSLWLVSGVYPFGIASVPTEEGRGFCKLLIGFAWNDFLHGSLIDVTRFDDDEVCTYKVNKPYVWKGSFGMIGASTSLSATTNPLLYATPAIYWE
jgi:hypothetical protein